jgi:GLEYA domain
MSTSNGTGVVYPMLRNTEVKEEALIDPVNKFRVSQPQTLIDTDFEYGLQTTKWETVEMVNNIPSFFSRNGDDPIPLADVMIAADSYLVTVTTASAHNLSKGSPIMISGLDSVTAEGSYCVLSVLSATQFIYRARQKQTTTRSIFDTFSTYLYPARVFQATQYSVSRLATITTDTNASSRITVNTLDPHGFSVGSSFMITNSIGGKRVQFAASLVDPADTLTFTYDVTSPASNPDGSNFTARTVVPYAYQSKRSLFFNPLTDVNTTNRTVTLPSHGLTTGESVMYVPPPDDGVLGGLSAYKLYSVVRVDANTVNLRDYTQSASTLTSGWVCLRYGVHHGEGPSFYVTQKATSISTVTSFASVSAIGVAAGTFPANNSLMLLGYFRPNSTASTWQFSLKTAGSAYMWIGDTAISGFTMGPSSNAVVNNGGSHAAQTIMSANLTLTSGEFYPVRIIYGTSSGAGDLALTFSGPSVAATSNGALAPGFWYSTYNSGSFTPSVDATNIALSLAGTSATNGNHALLKAYPVRSVNFQADTVTLSMNTSNSANARLINNDAVAIFSGDTKRRGFGLENFATCANNIYSTAGSSNPNYTLYYVRNTPVVGPLTTDLQLSLSPGGSVRDITSSYNLIFGLTWAVPVSTILEFSSFYSAGHGMSNNDQVVYTVLSGTGPSGLVSGTTYYAEVVSTNFFRLKSGTGASPVVAVQNFGTSASMRFVRTIVNPNANTIYSPSHDLIDSTPVVYTSGDNSAIPGLTKNATYYVINSTNDRFALTSVKGSLANMINITSTGSGTHQVFAREAVDGNYTVVTVPSSTSFEMQANFQVPALQFAINTRQNLVISANIFYVTQHRLMTGTPLMYDSNGNSAFGGLSQGSTYYAIRIDTNTFRLAASTVDAVNGTAIAITSGDDGSVHYLSTTTLSGEFVVPGVGFALSGSNILTCNTGIDFLSNFRIGDRFMVEVPGNVVSVTVSAVDATNDVVTTATTHGLSTGDAVWYMTASPSSVISGLAQNTMYYVGTSGTGVTSASTQFKLYNTLANAQANTNSIDIQSTLPVGIFSRVLPTAFDISTINVSNGTPTGILTLGVTSHNWSTGDYVVYTANITGTISGLTDGNIYYVNVSGLGANQVQLHPTFNDAVGSTNAMTITSAVLTGRHVLNKVTSNTIFESMVTEIKSSSAIGLATSMPITAPTCSPILTTLLYPRADGYTMHRAYDGGVEIIPSMNPDSQIIRQTRKYFRYQSGKGIQVSKSVNFSPPTPIEGLTRNGAVATALTRRPHRLSPGVPIVVEGVSQTTDAESSFWNGAYTVLATPTVDSFTFALSTVPPETVAGGYPAYTVSSWVNSAVRVGLFDDQNGIFFEYDGTNLNCVRRNSTKQLSGAVTVAFNSQLVSGSANTRFLTALVVGDRVVIKGQTYKVIDIPNDSTFYVQPPYRGVNATNVIVTRTTESRVPQSQWSVDRCDGNGPTGYDLDIHKIQMIYIDYAWYGGGKVRFGFKDTMGRCRYVHEFIHNNNFTEAYLRSGNLPARYEVATTGVPSFVPALMHWGTSVIMDGRFDEDGAYLFTAAGSQLSFGNGDSLTFTVTFSDATKQNFFRTYTVYDPTLGTNVKCYRMYTSTAFTTVQNIRSGTTLTGSGLDAGTRTVGAPIKDGGSSGAFIYINVQPQLTAQGTALVTGAQSITAGDPTDFLPNFIPLISIRLSPSVDNGRPGALGSREIVNRMQLQLKSIGILTTHDSEIRLLLNGYPYTKSWVRVTPPSLGQLIYHTKNDMLNGGTQIFAFRASGGSPDSTGRRTSTNAIVSLEDLSNLGNSILAGDDVFPNGPDVLTIGATCLDTSGITITTPFSITGRITWAESQA